MDIYNNLRGIQEYCSEQKHQFNTEELARLTTKERDILKFIEEYDNKAEQILLGHMLTGEEDRVKAVVEKITVEKFYNEKHKKIFNAILKLYNESKKTYVIPVKEKLEETGELEQIGGSEYFYDLVEIGSTDSNFKKYIEYIEDRPTI